MGKKACFLFGALFLFFRCTTDRGQPLFKRVAHSGVTFTNQVIENDSMNIMELEYFYRGGGVGIGDVNRDGLPDIFLGGNMTPSRLYLNQGGLHFTDITEAAGLHTGRWINGVSLVDINADGWLDLYLCAGGSNTPARRRNLFYINQGLNDDGIPVFVDQAATLGLDSDRNSTQSAFFDYDRDGDLDLFLINTDPDNKNPNVVRAKRVDGSSPNTDQLFKNLLKESGRLLPFTDVSAEAGIRFEGFSLGLAISDLNLDGWPDIYIANDHLSNDLLYINQGSDEEGRVAFTNRIGDMLTSQSYYSMGVAIKDLNGDGRNDIFTLDMLPERNDRRQKMVMAMSLNKFMLAEEYGYQNQFMKNTLQVNMGQGADGLPLFSEAAQLAGIHNTDWSWGCVAADFDHDGHNDLIITNGYARDITDMDFVAYQKGASYFETNQYSREYRTALQSQPPILLPNVAFRNRGDLQFEDVSAAWGFDEPDLSSGIAYSDLDLDGDLDLVINHLNRPASIYENTLEPGIRHYVKIQPVTEAGAPAIGVRIQLFAGGKKHAAELYPVQGFQSVQDPAIHIGLGKTSLIDSVLIDWPDGYHERYYELLADRTYQWKKGRGTPVTAPLTAGPAAPFRFQMDTLDWIHQPYPPFDDFYTEPLLPHSFSQESPLLAAEDIDGNGTLDFFVSSGPRQAGVLYFQSSDGKLTRRPFDKDGAFEDMGAAWLDADGDGDADLFVCSGGTRHLEGDASLQDRLYLQEAGDFILAKNALPAMATFTKSPVTLDFDGDGDDDLFVGGRTVYSDYPRFPQSYLLENKNGAFRDVSADRLPAAGKLGMIADAAVADLDQDGIPELILAVEWGPVTILQWSGDAYLDVTDRFAHAQRLGWWQSVKVADINRDGFPDILAGNLGLNNPFAENLPLKLFHTDLDRNGKQDAILAWHAPSQTGKRRFYPFALRDELTAQIPSIKTSYPTYAAFSSVAITDLLQLSEEEVTEKTINSLESVLLINRGGNDFNVHALPKPAQWGPGHAFLIADFNRDGRSDLLCAGNAQNLPVAMSWNDAFMGVLLLADDSGFSHLPNREINLFLRHQIRDVLRINTHQFILTNYAGAPLVLNIQHEKPPENEAL